MSEHRYSLAIWMRDAAKPRPHQRKGQRMFNALREMSPDLADAIAGTAWDPFYDDRQIPAFVSRVCGSWDKYTPTMMKVPR